MAYGGYWVVENHARSCPAHYGAYLIAHVWPIAVYLASFAGGLCVAKLAPIEPAVGIALQGAVLLC